MDFQELMETKFLSSYDNLKKILSHYSCPDRCKAHCCRSCDIQFGKLEYKKIAGRGLKFQHILNTKTKILREKIMIDGCVFIGFELKQKPCPFLKKNRCSIQDVKPLTCEIYPFALAKPAHPKLVCLEPCPMGVEVMADYMLFKYLHVINADSSEEEKKAIIEEDLKLFRQSVESQKNMWTLGKVLDIHISPEILDFFAEFLDYTTEEGRKIWRYREDIGIEAIKNESINNCQAD